MSFLPNMPVADSHCDFLYKYSGFSNEKSYDVTRCSLKEGGVKLQTLAAFANSARLGEGTQGAYRKQVADFPVACEKLGLVPLKSAGQLWGDEKNEKYAILAVEGCEAFGGSIEGANEYIDAGAKIFALTWNHENDLAFPHSMAGGIKPFGKEIIGLLNEKKCAVDVSHLNEEGFWQVADGAMGARSVCASHSCCRAICEHSRNLSDEQIRAIIARGGYIGVNFYPPFLSASGRAGVKDIIRHIFHIIDLGGEDNVGFGSDFDGIDIKTDDMESPAGFGGLIRALKDAGVSDGILRKIAFENFVGFLRRTGI
jgi:membrane dipeptidase